MHIPKIGGAHPKNFDCQFEHADSSGLSFCTTPIFLLANDGTESIVSHGTGFIWRHASQCYLISARHIFSGTEPFSDKLISPNKYVPKIISCYISVMFNGSLHRLKIPKLELYEDDQPLWKQDLEFEILRTDIAALPIKIELDQGVEILALNDDANLNKPIYTQVGMECVLLGYPTINVTDFATPVWRKGIIASEPLLPIDNKPMFLLDASTTHGFSGAPVLRRQWGALPKRLENGQFEVDIKSILATQLVGVYAGRLNHKSVGGETPFVFYANRIPYLFV